MFSLRSLLRIFGHQYYIRVGIRDRVIRHFHNPDKTPCQDFSVNFFGYTYIGNFSTFIDWNVFYYGAYAIQELSFIKDVLTYSANAIMIDIGANVGNHSLFSAKYAALVHAFEPYPPVLEKAKEKINRNNITNIIMHPVGIGLKDEILEFYHPNTNNTGTGSFIGYNANKIKLQVCNADNYIEKLHLPNVDLIKIDIEGYEPYALAGLSTTLAKYRPIIFFEWTANGRGINADLKTLFPAGYNIYNFISDQPLFKLFNKPKYKLVADNTEADTNKVAIPIEQVYKFQKKFKADTKYVKVR